MRPKSKVLQIPMDLGHRVAFGRDDFLVADCNVEAVQWVDLWPEWPSQILILHGPSSSGKSHLAAVWSEKSKATYWTAKDVLSHKKIQEEKALIIERADLLIGDKDAETDLFHLYNLAKEESIFVLMTMTCPPSHLTFCVKDLESRLRSSQSIGIHAPDDEVLGAVIVKLFSDRQISISPDVLRYILPRMDRSFDAARQIVEKADQLSLAKKKPISIPLIREVLLHEDQANQA